MSVIMVARIHCDDCGREQDFDGDYEHNPTRTEARAYYKEHGWRTGLKATLKRPSEYDTRTDICPYCR